VFDVLLSHVMSMCCRMSRFEKTNEMLLNFNRLSDVRYESTQTDFRKHIHLLHEMRKDLDNIFRRIRLVTCFFATACFYSMSAYCLGDRAVYGVMVLGTNRKI